MVTVNDILDRFVRDSLPRRGLRTQRDYLRHVRVLRREFGDRVAEELKPKDFGPFLEVEKGPIQRVRQLAVLSSAFTDAVSRWYMLERNVLRDVKRRKNRPRDRLILDSEFAACKAVANPRMQLAMMLALLTAQRQSDLIRFRWSDIRGMDLHVQQSKTRKRIAIAINAELEAVLDLCWLLPGGGKDGSEYIIPTSSGKPYTSEGFRACWQRTIKRAMRGRPAYRRRKNKPVAELAPVLHESFHFHDIRALAATKCATPEIAMRLLGHASMAMTMRVYRRGVEHVDALEVS